MGKDHTPTPWAADGTIILIPSGIIPHVAYCHDSSGDSLMDNGKANAAFIVRAVNCHYELVAALRAMVEAEVDYMTLNLLGDPEQQHNVKRARAIIAKTESA